MPRELDPLLHSQLRLAVVPLLMTAEEADFIYLRKLTGASAGNLSIPIDKLFAAGYIEVRKKFVGKRARTACRVTARGRDAFEAYAPVLQEYIGPSK